MAFLPRPIACMFAVSALLALPSIADATSDNKLAQRLAANCAACHGTAGVAVSHTLPPLAGQPRDNLISSMQAFKSGTRPSTVMQQLAKGYTDEQIALIAGYFSGLKVAEAGGAK